MKSQILQTLAALALIATSATAQDNPMENHTASYIAMPAAEGQSEAFAEFLAGAHLSCGTQSRAPSFGLLCKPTIRSQSLTSLQMKRHGTLTSQERLLRL